MHTLFIADLHLCEKKPKIVNKFLYFLQHHAIHADALYILGDLFDIWIGDDYYTPLHEKIISALKKLTNIGVPCYFIHGNRDFLIGKCFANASGVQLLPEKKY